MNPYRATLYNAAVLCILGCIGYYVNNFNAHTALVPIGSSLLLFALSPWVKKNNQTVFTIVAVFSLLLMILLIWPLKRNIDQADDFGIMRVTIEMLSCALAVFVYSKFYFENRTQS